MTRRHRERFGHCGLKTTVYPSDECRAVRRPLCAGRCAQVLPAETRPVGRDLRRTGRCQWLYRERAKIVHDDSRCKHDFVYMENVNKTTSKCG